ncbi:MAG: hydrogenase 4 subunit B [Methylococcales bacterium]|nr:hydrogenase 4 subunit B [Methylococcales bacterium]
MILFLAYAAVCFSLLSGLLALLARQRNRVFVLIRKLCTQNSTGFTCLGSVFTEENYLQRIQQIVFISLGVAGVFAIAAGLAGMMSQSVARDVLPLGLPWLPWHVRFDSLSALFYLIIGIAIFTISFYGPGYVKNNKEQDHPFAILGLFSGLFIAGMLMVLLADDAFFFMMAWEMMSVASYFLVAFQHENSANRRAAFIYLIMAEVGAIAIILAFGVLTSFSTDYSFTFDALRNVSLSRSWASIAFVLALVGFGMKAGLVPLHVWLPEAHPVAPSHISALMSGVMLKVAVYGLIRFSFDLLGDIQWKWGVILMIFGSISALGGILYAMMQPNLKRLLAYSSVENIGIIFMVLGLSMIFLAKGHPNLAALGFVAALFHAFNHALFKNLLFLGAGIIQHQVHSLNIEDMGGLIKRMPHTSKLFLIACMSISSLPLLNGFVSEWLAFQTALQVGVLDDAVLRSLIPVMAAALALTAALAAACFVKLYSIMFLGLPRSRHADKAEETQDKGMLLSLSLLAGLCFLFGIFPGLMLNLLDNVAVQIIGQGMPNAAAAGWIWLEPVSAQQASYAAPIVLIFSLIAGGISFYYLRRDPAVKLRQSDTWDCGFGGLTPRMQYTSMAFTMPFRRIFAKVWKIDEVIDKQAGGMPLQVTDIRYQLHIEDHSWVRLYQPIERTVNKTARLVSRMQTGNIRVYLSYSFFTLLFLLWVIS